jgi:hypothetical protein
VARRHLRQDLRIRHGQEQDAAVAKKKYGRADGARVRSAGGQSAAAGYSITSSAKMKRCGGMVSPSASAVLRLIFRSWVSNLRLQTETGFSRNFIFFYGLRDRIGAGGVIEMGSRA